MVEPQSTQSNSSDEVQATSRVDGEPVQFGHGWISGVAGIALSGAGLFVVLCIRFPRLLTMPALREVYPLPAIRALLHLVLIAGFLMGLTSLTLRRRKIFGGVAVGLALTAAVLGGSQIPQEVASAGDSATAGQPALSLDWFLLNLILWSAVLVPLERWFALRREQPIFRHGWRTDLTYFFVSTLAVQWILIFTMQPAQVLFAWVMDDAWRSRIGAQPLVLQTIEILLLTDFVQYWVHRSFHRVPFLWRFHAIHHSTERMDWLAGSRLHLVDILVTRGLTYIPLFILGFTDAALLVYGVIVTLQATLIHANLRFTFGPARYFVVTPQFHHWHHSDQAEAIDKNFAVHLPIWDWLFGSYYLPDDRWPQSYGVHGPKPPEGFLKQLLWPVRPSQ